MSVRKGLLRIVIVSYMVMAIWAIFWGVATVWFGWIGFKELMAEPDTSLLLLHATPMLICILIDSLGLAFLYAFIYILEGFAE